MNLRGFRQVPFFAIAVIALAVSLQAQSSPPGPQQPIFRTRTEHVSLDVVVTDKNDRPITDLTAADFRITDGDRPQKIADFRLVSVPPAHETVNLATPPPAPSDVATNGRSADGRVVAFIFDMSLSPADIVPWKREMTNFLEKMAPDDQMAVVYVGRSDLGEDFTNDAGRLVRAINNLPTAMFGLGNNPLAQRFGGQIPCGRHPAQCTLMVVDNVVKTLAAAHQSRRFIVLASAWGCIPGGPRNFYAQQCHDLIEDAKRADVPIYGIGPPGPFEAPGSLQVLAQETGGLAFANTPELKATTEILADNGSYYLLGFYPNPLATDGKFHRVKVTVSRPGAHVRARQGYVAPHASSDASTPTRAMELSLAAGVDDPRLPIRATVVPIASNPHGMKALITVDVAYATATGQGRIDDTLQLGVLALDPDGHVRAELQRPLRFSATSPGFGSATFAVDDVIDLPSQQLVLRVGVSSRALDRTGTIHFPLTVPNPAHGDLQLSGIVIGLPGAKPLPVLGADLVGGLVPFQPTTERSFATTDALRVFARAFWGAKDAAVTATVTITGGPERAPTTMTVPATDAKGSRHEAVIDTTMPLTGLAPGPHTLEINARLADGSKAHREMPFEIR